jgi:hypothetical protein
MIFSSPLEAVPDLNQRRILTPELSALTPMTQAWSRPEATIMAGAIFSGRLVVRQAIVDPEPLSHPPNAPLAEALSSTFGKKGSNLLR